MCDAAVGSGNYCGWQSGILAHTKRSLEGGNEAREGGRTEKGWVSGEWANRAAVVCAGGTKKEKKSVNEQAGQEDAGLCR